MSEPRNRMTAEEEQRAYLLGVLAKTGWSQTQLAQRAALDPSTLSRFLGGGRAGHALRASTLAKIAAASGVPLEGEAPAPLAGFAEAEATPLRLETRSDIAAIIAGLAAPGRAIDPWTLNSRALESAGYRPGDVLLVALDEVPLLGDVVCAQIYDWAKGGARTVFRLYQPPYLIAATSDPGLMRPFESSDASTAIKGVVIASIRRRGSEIHNVT
jgi:transcriptional regulator with XRE-family HTH domain